MSTRLYNNLLITCWLQLEKTSSNQESGLKNDIQCVGLIYVFIFDKLKYCFF